LATKARRKAVTIDLRPGEAFALMAEIPAGVDGYLSKRKVAALLSISESLLKEWIQEGKYPRPDAHFGKLPRWRYSTHNAFCTALAESAR
jgi:hypothetical protein